ncbi:ornithine carbamoyltransferase [candidate division KSB3 bacterium]|uniref:Ornithine carbamoyltransferase n=1 Tax=candidate division KSB3 bacterium TaxID=2044937 RepID=A0A2G6E596_9BACT|nr:MAG: ornithine carbamoyltransferase [candidate division KSB3 bacterium]PIE29502.1 MAG: ornithine carbamoyltransferase [candidate division KSB3 bacterium]
MKGKNLLSLHDLCHEEVLQVLKTAQDLKLRQQIGERPLLLERKTVAMIFQKPSLRTRVSFETGITQLGGHAIYLGPDDISLGTRESVEDIAQVLSRYIDLIMARVFGHDIVADLARYATVPVINGLSDLTHPCQALGDLLTIQEKKLRMRGLKLAFIGDGNNVANSLLYAGAKVGMHVSVASPEGYELRDDVLAQAREDALATGAQMHVTHDPLEAVQDADIVYTDVWASMGQEAEAEARKALFQPFQVNMELFKHAKADAVFMHCLPAHYGEEVTDEVARSPHSVIYDQAENRMHAQNALMALVL